MSSSTYPQLATTLMLSRCDISCMHFCESVCLYALIVSKEMISYFRSSRMICLHLIGYLSFIDLVYLRTGIHAQQYGCVWSNSAQSCIIYWWTWATAIHTGQRYPPTLPPHLTSPHLTSPHLTSPHLTSPPIVINGQKAAMSSAAFADKRSRTLELLLTNIATEFDPHVCACLG